MKYLELFEGLNEEDITDYFLEMCDEKLIKFSSVGFTRSGALLTYTIGTNFNSISKDNVDILYRIISICKRWNLEFKIKGHSRNNSHLEITLPIPAHVRRCKNRFVRKNIEEVDVNGQMEKFYFRLQLTKDLDYFINVDRCVYGVDRTTRDSFVKLSSISDIIEKHISTFCPVKFLRYVNNREGLLVYKIVV